MLVQYKIIRTKRQYSNAQPNWAWLPIGDNRDQLFALTGTVYSMVYR